MRLAIASAVTLSLLFGMLFSVMFVFAYFYGYLNAYLLIALTLILNFVLWLVSPSIADLIYRWVYRVRWISLNELGKLSPTAAEVIKSVCKTYGFKIPKLGIIPDRNPNAFTYGSGRWNARIIATEGIFEYLDDNEIASVYAHELGHIKNRDFIIMTVASVILQLLYEFYVIFRESSKSGRRKGGVALLAIISYVFYLIAQYIVLYLSRVREYYADEFAARHTHANYLSSALIKIAYGILANPDNVRLVESTKFIGIMNFKAAKSIGMVYYNCEKLNDFEPLARALLFDIHNPWASVYELSSTHPLTGKRIKRLCKLSSKPLFNFEMLERKYRIDKKLLWKNFFREVAVLLLPFGAVALYVPVYLYLVYSGLMEFSLFNFIGAGLAILGVFILIKTLYRYPSRKGAEKTRVIELMGNVYASPVRGKYVELNGTLVGRGIPGYVFSEDMLMEDETGLIYLNYESWLPVLGNILFALRKVNKLIGKDVKVKGWFLRGLSQEVVVDVMEVEGERIRGFTKFGGMIGGCILLAAGTALLLI